MQVTLEGIEKVISRITPNIQSRFEFYGWRRGRGRLPAWLLSGRHVRHYLIHVVASDIFLILVAPTARARIIHSHQNTLKVGVDSERRFLLFRDVGELDGGVRRKHGLLTTMHVALSLVCDEPLFTLETV